MSAPVNQRDQNGHERGRISLVGAGPGDPDLLTQRAVRRLAEADLVLYDALVAPEVRPLAPRAQWISVGKRACRPSISQEAINRCLVRAARRGRRVVRLKCGDPFVFGRGGEEALALAAAGVAFEIVPGVSSALAAPALAGIPVTHRGLASSFVVVSGHSPSAYAPVVDAIVPETATLVVLMGLRSRAALASHLIARGWSAQTPAAVLLAAASPDARVWLGTIGGLAADGPGLADGAGLANGAGIHDHTDRLQEGDGAPHTALGDALGDAPGTIVIGPVVSLAYQLGAWQHGVAAGLTEPAASACGDDRQAHRA